MFVNTPVRPQEVHVRLRARDAVLVGARLHAADPELVHEVDSEWPSVCETCQFFVSCTNTRSPISMQVRVGPVVVRRVRVADEHPAELAESPGRRGS